ncbi:MAG: helix-turn-helix domain-containing protein [Flammeovirgaceae bacterium]
MKEIFVLNTIAQIHSFMNLPSPKHPLVSILQHGRDFTRDDLANMTVRFNFYQVIYKDGCEGEIGYGRNSYDYIDGSLIFIKPGQTFTIDKYELNPESKGWSLFFHPDLIRKSPLGKTIDDYSYFSYDVTEALHVSELEKESLEGLLAKIELEYSQNLDKHSQKLIVSNIELLLDYCTRYYDRQFLTRTNLNSDFVSDFEQLLKGYFDSKAPLERGLPSVKYCGEEMNMSPNYLSDLLKKETGKSAQEHIHLHVVDRAKTRLLGSTDLVSQIAFDLGFEYPQHFSKLFKSKTGMSPAAYRNLN